jgi:hypothetical protein
VLGASSDASARVSVVFPAAGHRPTSTFTVTLCADPATISAPEESGRIVAWVAVADPDHRIHHIRTSVGLWP